MLESAAFMNRTGRLWHHLPFTTAVHAQQARVRFLEPSEQTQALGVQVWASASKGWQARPGRSCRGGSRRVYSSEQKVTATTSSTESLVDISDLLKSVASESKDFVFEDDSDGEADSDPFAPRAAPQSPTAPLNEAEKVQVLPTPADVRKVLSAYEEAPAMTTPEISVAELRAALASADPPLVIDVRSPEEYAEMHVPEAVNLPLPDVVERVQSGEVDVEGRQVALICRSGMRSARAAGQLSAALGLQGLLNVKGGTLAWADQQFPLTTSKEGEGKA